MSGFLCLHPIVPRFSSSLILSSVRHLPLPLTQHAELDEEVRSALPDCHSYWHSAKKSGYSGTLLLTPIKPKKVWRGFHLPSEKENRRLKSNQLERNQAFDIPKEEKNLDENQVKDKSQEEEEAIEDDEEGRLLGAEFEKFRLINVYTPNSGNISTRRPYRMNWDDKFCRYVSDLLSLPPSLSKPLIICGDLNVAHRPIDVARAAENLEQPGFTSDERATIDRLLGLGLVDSFRAMNGFVSGFVVNIEFVPDISISDVISYSYWDYRMRARRRNIGWRIDYALLSTSLLPHVKEAFIMHEVEGSDHAPVGLLLDKALLYELQSP